MPPLSVLTTTIMNFLPTYASTSWSSPGIRGLPLSPASIFPQAFLGVGDWDVVREVFEPLDGPAATSN